MAPPAARLPGGPRSTSSLESAGPAAPRAKEDLHTVSDLQVLEVRGLHGPPVGCRTSSLGLISTYRKDITISIAPSVCQKQITMSSNLATLPFPSKFPRHQKMPPRAVLQRVWQLSAGCDVRSCVRMKHPRCPCSKVEESSCLGCATLASCAMLRPVLSPLPQ